jgi:lysophospholipid acyltransferase (LPLAT)-like uncharacterized protein
MPYPFSRGVFICGEPIRVDADAGTAEMEEARTKLEQTLIGLTERVDNYF